MISSELIFPLLPCSISPGDVRIWDLRQHEALAFHSFSDIMTTMAVHPLANMYAW